MAERLPHMQQVLSGRYRIDREVGRGAMAVVFIAEDLKHNRSVAIKALKPDLSRVIASSRFLREIEILAHLNHPGILPLYDSGVDDDVVYFVMPIIEGESLRSRLMDGKGLPFDQAVAILIAVSEGIGYAHDKGIVHRDLKPENILFQEGHPLISDFGIAHAARISQAGVDDRFDTLTGAGISLGTPAYMSPEQAAADPSIDYRTDLYSLGAVAYELLTGNPPFVRESPQQVIAAHIIEKPRSVSEVRPETPRNLETLVMSCLEKDPAYRPQSAMQLTDRLQVIASEFASVPITRAALGRQQDRLHLALGLYSIAVLVVMGVAWKAMNTLGLPGWVLPGTLLVMIPGLPFIFLTAYAHRVDRSTARPRTSREIIPGLFHQHLSWRRVSAGGLLAVTLFAIFVMGFMELRARGIGPMATLISSGKLKERGTLLLAGFVVTSPDSTLAATLTTATRTALDQSKSISLVPDAMVRETLKRMKKARGQINLDVATEIAEREGIPAIIQGEATSVGGRWLLSLKLYDARSAATLASRSTDVDKQSDFISAIDKLSRQIRGDIGESFKSVRMTPPLERVTTASLEALRKYTAGVYANGVEQDWPKAIHLAQEAIALDSGFALAWRGLAAAGANAGRGQAFVDSALSMAFRHSDRLPANERASVSGMYYAQPLVGPGLEFDVPWRRFGHGRDRAKAAESYEGLVENDIAQAPTLLPLGLIYQSRREYGKAEAIYRGILMKYPENALAHMHLFEVLFDQGNIVAADSERKATQRYEKTPVGVTMLGTLLFSRSEFAAYENHLQTCVAGPLLVRRLGLEALSDFSLMRGRLQEFQRFRSEAREMGPMFGLVSPVVDSVLASIVDAEFRGQKTIAFQRLNTAVKISELVPKEQREDLAIAEGYARIGRPDQARGILQRHERNTTDSLVRRSERPLIDGVRGRIALAEGRPREAISYFRRADMMHDGPLNDCGPCLPLNLGFAYDAANSPDSAIMMFERYLKIPHSTRAWEIKLDPLSLGRVLERLGQLYDAKNDSVQAMQYYRRFVGLWDKPDIELQARVKVAKNRLVQLQVVN